MIVMAGFHLKGVAGNWWAEHEDDADIWQLFEKYIERYASKSTKGDIMVDM